MTTSFREGDQVLIIGGPFVGKVGSITRIDSDSATVICNVFDRNTPVEADLKDLEQP
jgi:transcription antitermination factor NusG